MRTLAIVPALAFYCSHCGHTGCDPFATVGYDVTGHEADACTLVLASPSGSASATYAFPVPTEATCAGCFRASCTPESSPAPTYCARTYMNMKDMVAVQFDASTVGALSTQLRGSAYTATVTCGAATVIDHEAHAVDCLPR